MDDLKKEIENELAEYLYSGVQEFSGVENGNFPLARKILTLSSLQIVIKKAEKYDNLFEKLRVEEEEVIHYENSLDTEPSAACPRCKKSDVNKTNEYYECNDCGERF